MLLVGFIMIVFFFKKKLFSIFIKQYDLEFGGNVSTKSIVDFIDAGGNVLVAANSQLSKFFSFKNSIRKI